MEFPTKAYLKCEDRGQGCFSSERILRFHNSNGKFIDGFFDNGNIEKGLGLKVTAIEEVGNSTQIILPQNEVYGPSIRADGRYWVKSERITYEGD